MVELIIFIHDEVLRLNMSTLSINLIFIQRKKLSKNLIKLLRDANEYNLI